MVKPGNCPWQLQLSSNICFYMFTFIHVHKSIRNKDCFVTVNWTTVTQRLRDWMSLEVPLLAWKQLGRRRRNGACICYPSRMLCSFIHTCALCPVHLLLLLPSVNCAARLHVDLQLSVKWGNIFIAKPVISEQKYNSYTSFVKVVCTVL